MRAAPPVCRVREPRRWALLVAAVVVVAALRLVVTTPPLSGGTITAFTMVAGAAWLVWATGRPVRGA